MQMSNLEILRGRVRHSQAACARGVLLAPLIQLHRAQVIHQRWRENLVDECQRLAIVPEDVFPAPEGPLVAKAPKETHTHTHSALNVLTFAISSLHSM